MSDAKLLTPPWEPLHLFLLVPPVDYEDFATAWERTQEMPQPTFEPVGVFDGQDRKAHAVLTHDMDVSAVEARLKEMGFPTLYLSPTDARRQTKYVQDVLQTSEACQRLALEKAAALDAQS